MGALSLLLYVTAVLAMFYIGYLMGRLRVLDAGCEDDGGQAAAALRAFIRENPPPGMPQPLPAQAQAQCPPGTVPGSEQEYAAYVQAAAAAATAAAAAAPPMIASLDDRAARHHAQLHQSPSAACPPPPVSPFYMHKRVQNQVAQDQIFGFVNHAAQPTKGDLILTHFPPLTGAETPKYDAGYDVLLGDVPVQAQLEARRARGEVGVDASSVGPDPLHSCGEVYLTRTGSRESKSPKCVAIVRAGSKGQVSPNFHSHRMGTVASYRDQYQTDWSKDVGDENALLRPLIKHRAEVIAQLRAVLGDPVVASETQPDGSVKVTRRKTAVVMVANEGVVDLVLNLLCSCRAAGIDTSTYVIFVGSEEDVGVINAMGVHAIFNPLLGSMPKNAAFNYGDRTFSRMMWLKVSCVYVATMAGYNVLFQDADLVWFQPPLPFLESFDDITTSTEGGVTSTSGSDILFMDDGGRTPRFTPLYVNSGFYFQRHNPRTVYLMEKMLKSVAEIATTHSHQATLIRHIVEGHDLFGLQIRMVDQRLFPSGFMYHHDKKYLAAIKEYRELPYVFHMCWTDNKDQKIAYFKEIGMWYLPPETASVADGRTGANLLRKGAGGNVCATTKTMQGYLAQEEAEGRGGTGRSSKLLERCCQPAPYFENKPK